MRHSVHVTRKLQAPLWQLHALRSCKRPCGSYMLQMLGVSLVSWWPSAAEAGASWRGCQAARLEGAAPCEGYEDTADHACPACCSSSHSSGAGSRDASRASAGSSDAESGTPRS